jgi:hypothetical protein
MSTICAPEKMEKKGEKYVLPQFSDDTPAANGLCRRQYHPEV